MIRHLLLAALLLAPNLQAQESDRSDLKVRFLAERVPENLGQVVVGSDKAKSAPFDLPMNNMSPPIVAPGRNFDLKMTAKDLTLAKIVLPDAGKSFVVLLVPNPQGGYLPVVLRADDPAFKGGDVYFYNNADKTVLGYVGTAKFVLAPGKAQILRPEGPKKPENIYNVGFGVREKEGDRALSTTTWPVDDRERSYIFFFTNSTTKRVDFRAVDEFVGAAPAVP